MAKTIRKQKPKFLGEMSQHECYLGIEFNPKYLNGISAIYNSI